MSYIPLYIKTDNSFQDSFIVVPKLIEFAKDNGIKELGIADKNMYGVMDFYKLCLKENIKPYIGLEIKYQESIFILYAKNYDGYKNLLKLTTIQSEREVTLEELERYSKDLVCLLPYESSNLLTSINGLYENLFRTYKNDQEKSNITKPYLYMRESIYLEPNYSEYVKYLDAIREGVELSYVSSTRLENDIMPHASIDEDDFDTFRELCNVTLPFHQDLMPIYENEEGIDSISYLKKKCIEGLKKKFGNSVGSKYQERLKKELDVITTMGFCDYFLIVYDYIKYAKENNIIVGPGRGSAVGSLVAYLLDITDIDPLKYDLLFERFLNVERISMPDIDIDFEHNKREDMIEYCRRKYGEKRVAPIITFGTLGAKQALRDVGKAFGLELTIIDGLCKIIDSKLTLKENLANPKVSSYISRYDNLDKVYNISYAFEGLKRHSSIHAAGVVMSRVDLDTVIPLDKSHLGFYTSGYDMTYLEEIGLLKMDFLAIKYLTIIHNMIDDVNRNYDVNLTFDNIPNNDKKALKIFYDANTLGIFQFESDGIINFLSQLKATSFDDICSAIALYRPGPMHNIPEYIKRKNNPKNIDYFDESLMPILKSTYGIMIYQEQIMQIANVMANYTLGEADILRKAMSKKKKDLLLEEEEKFTKRAIEKGYNKDLVSKVYGMMLKFAEYGFNKSHSVGYSLVSYRMAYLKAHYPKIYMANLLSIEMNDDSKLKKYFYECHKLGINILKPDINKSNIEFVMEEDGVRFPLTNIRNVGINAARIIVSEREKGPFKDLYDFIKRCYGSGVNRKVLESLNMAGVFLEFGWNRKTVIENMDSIINFGELIHDLDEEFVLKPDINIVEEYSKKEIMNSELDIFGLYLSIHPVTEYKMKYKNSINLSDVPNYFDKRVEAIVIVERVKEISTKSGNNMCFIVGSDEISTIDITVFPKIYEELGNLSKGDLVHVFGNVEKRFDKYQIVASKIEKLEKGE